MSESYVIEVDDLSAGIVVRERAGYRFFAAAFQFFRMDGQVFGTVSRAERAAGELFRLKHARPPAMHINDIAASFDSTGTDDAAQENWFRPSHASAHS
jgi:hypothetical protein